MRGICPLLRVWTPFPVAKIGDRTRVSSMLASGQEQPERDVRVALPPQQVFAILIFLSSGVKFRGLTSVTPKEMSALKYKAAISPVEGEPPETRLKFLY